ncbi:MFS transporter [Paraburkholderia fungorum]|jgi:MFS family permease|uniref:MFS transporter n=1 Tax=Paraburkholderia fungorum TaxID=134537 RepID=UPI0038B9E246
MKRSIISPTERAEFRRSWPVLLAATVGCFSGLTTIPFYSLGSFITPLQSEFGWGRGEISCSFLYLTLVLALTSPVLGYLIDRIGVRPVALVSIPLLSLVLFLISRFEGSINGFHALYGVAALVGGGATPIAYSRAVNGNFDTARGLALGISLAGMGLAAVVLPSMLSVTIQDHGWRAGYQLIALFTLVPWPFVYFGFKSQVTSKPRGHAAEFTRSEVLRTGVFWSMSLAFAASAVAVSALVVHMTPLLHDAGLSAAAVARIVSLIGLGVLGGRIVVGYLIDRFFAPYVAAVLFCGTALGCTLLLFAGVSVAPVAGMLTGLSLGAEVDLIAYMTSRYFGMKRYGFVYAIAYSIYAIGASSGPTLAGLSFDATHSYNSMLTGVIALLIGAAIAMLCLPRFERFSDGRAQLTPRDQPANA